MSRFEAFVRSLAVAVLRVKNARDVAVGMRVGRRDG
jgi:hypothetical protein